MKTWIGIDPGDRWTGIAVIQEVSKSELRAETGVIDGQDDIYRAVDLLSMFLKPRNTSVIVEQYSVRPVGHQWFTKALAVRLIGAIEYVSRKQRCTFTTIPPGDPNDVVTKMGIDSFIKSVVNVSLGDKRWRHALSAWRALALYLQKSEVDIFRRLRSRAVRYYDRDNFIPLIGDMDLWSRPIVWRT